MSKKLAEIKKLMNEIKAMPLMLKASRVEKLAELQYELNAEMCERIANLELREYENGK